MNSANTVKNASNAKVPAGTKKTLWLAGGVGDYVDPNPSVIKINLRWIQIPHR